MEQSCWLCMQAQSPRRTDTAALGSWAGFCDLTQVTYPLDFLLKWKFILLSVMFYGFSDSNILILEEEKSISPLPF